MIGYLKGRLLEAGTDHALVDVGGVGYEVHASALTLGDLEARSGEEVILWIHTHVREDILQLFGFANREEKSLFLSLLKVNGIGPKMALAMLGGARPAKLVELIEAGDAKGLSGLPKVGKKTAEQIILTLQGKLVRIEEPKMSRPDAHRQIQSALVNLGFKPQIVEEFVGGLPKNVAVEDGVRQGLTALSNV